jgi:apolipoprotein N-acyltransferase
MSLLKPVFLNQAVIVRLAIALFSGILMGLATAPVNAWPLAWIALVPLWILVVKGHKRGLKCSCLLGLTWGVGYHGFALSWITGIHPMTWMGIPWLASLAIALFCWSFITFWGAVIVTVWSGAMAWLASSWQSPAGRILLGVSLWCSLEWLCSQSPLWWTSVSYTQSPGNLVILHLGQLSGPLTVTAALIAVNGLIAEAFLQVNRHWRDLGLAASLLVCLHLLGWSLSSCPLAQPPATALQVGIIQGNIPNEIKLYSAGWQQALQGYTRGYRALVDQGVEAVLTPEGALPFVWTSADIQNSSFYQAILERRIVAWVGAYGQQGEKITNSLFTVTGKGEIFSRYDKEKLVPLGEYIPFENFLGKFVDRLSPLESHMAAGSPHQIFDTPVGRAIVSICYESAFPDHFQSQAAAGGEFILSAANNAHYRPTMPAQHHAQDVMRAIETDRWAVRATNTGYSGIVDPHGKTRWLSGLRTYEIHPHTIYRRQTRTPYVRWGNWLTPLLIVLSLGVWMIEKKLNFLMSLLI